MTLQDALKFVARSITGENSPQEQATFLKWLRAATVDEWDSVADEHERLYERWPVVAVAPNAEWVGGLEARLDRIAIENGSKDSRGPVVLMDTSRRIGRRIWAGAASVIVLLSAATLWYTQIQQKASPKQVEQTAVPVMAQSLEVQRGEKAKAYILPDGSKVWLNSASTLKYPAKFDGPERVVELSGQAFFEVAKDLNKPFEVLIKGAEVQVLGTKFDIMAYDDEPVSKTTLIDGAVKMKSGSEERVLRPGQQAQFTYESPGTTHENTITVVDVKTDAELDWRNGNIDYEDADLHAVMRTLSRYYNITINYASDLPATKPTTARIYLQDGLQHNLKLLEPQFRLHFKIDGKIVTVMP